MESRLSKWMVTKITWSKSVWLLHQKWIQRLLLAFVHRSHCPLMWRQNLTSGCSSWTRGGETLRLNLPRLKEDKFPWERGTWFWGTDETFSVKVKSMAFFLSTRGYSQMNKESTKNGVVANRHSTSWNRPGMLRRAPPPPHTIRIWFVVYCVTCKGCQAQYIGSTRQPFKKRYSHHKSAIKDGYELPYSRHFSKPGHDY